jgi:PST family polysaccharide transporter/lipopolysaccharide exporter
MNKEPLKSENILDGQKHEGALQKSLSAGHWFLADTIIQRVLVFGTFFITARLLTPADYGIIALAGIYPALLDSLTAIAFGTALTQKKAGEEKPYLNAVWTFGILRNAILFGTVFFTAPFIAHFFHADDALLVFRLSGLIFVLQSFENIGNIYFFRQLDFKKVFLRDMASYGTTAVISVLASILLHSYWALFIGNASGMLASVIATYLLNDYRPRPDLALRKLRPLLAYSQWVFGQGVINRLSQTLEDTLVGHFTNTASVGLYGKAKSLAYAPISPLSNIISKIGFSALVATEGSLPHIREGFYKSFDLVVAVALPFALFIWITGDQLVLLLLGPAWVEITPLLKTLVVVAVFNSTLLGIAGMVFNAIDKPNLYFRLNTLSLFSVILFLPIMVIRQGISGAALSLLISAIIVSTYALFLINKTIAPTWRRVGETVGVVTLSIFIPLPITTHLLNIPSASHLPIFLLVCVLYGISYTLMVMFFGTIYKKGPFQTLFVIAKSFVKKA